MTERVNVTIKKKNVGKINQIQEEFDKQGRSFSNFAVESTIAAYEKENK